MTRANPKTDKRASAPPLILAVDPGSTSGWAMYRPTEDHYILHRYGLVRELTGAKAARVIKRAVKARPDPAILVRLVIERSYIPRSGQVKGKGYEAKPGQGGSDKVLSSAAIEGLIMNRARWQVVAELMSLLVEIRGVKPQEWQTPIIGAGRGVKRAERKRRAKRTAEGFFPGATFVGDEPDAICIGLQEARLQVLPIARTGHPVRGERL